MVFLLIDFYPLCKDDRFLVLKRSAERGIVLFGCCLTLF